MVDAESIAQKRVDLVYSSDGLTSTEKGVALAIAFHSAFERPNQYLSYNVLSERTNLSKKTVKRCIEKLQDREFPFLKQKYCSKCGSEENLHEHHILPRCMGGSDKNANIDVLCESCHKYVHRVYNDAVRQAYESFVNSCGGE